MYGLSNATQPKAPQYQLCVTVSQSDDKTNFVTGRVCTATQGSVSVELTTDSLGVATFNLETGGDWILSCDAPKNLLEPSPVMVTIENETTYVYIELEVYSRYSLNFDESAYPTDPTGCLTYGEDCEGFTPVSNPNTSALGSANLGSWGFNSYGYGPLGIFYATLNADRTISSILNPNNLALNIDGTPSDIETLNTMLVIPTLYIKRSIEGILLSNDPDDGTPYAHTFDGHVYKYIGIGVYKASMHGASWGSYSGGGVMYGDIPPDEAREQVQANGEGWMLWNYYQWMLMRDLGAWFPAKSFDVAPRIGYVNQSNQDTGVTDAYGPWAGALGGQNCRVKALIEDLWGNGPTYIDAISGYNNIWTAEQSLNPHIPGVYVADAPVVLTPLNLGMGYGSTIYTEDVNFGIMSSLGGTASTGICEPQIIHPSEQGPTTFLLLGIAGPSAVCMGYRHYIDPNDKYETGYRIACAFD